MRIDVFSDLVCPWCYIGNHRLSRALAERPHARVTRRWHPFPLNPDLPRHGMNSGLYMALRFGSRDRARQAQAVVEDAARRDGIPLDLTRITHTPNTLDAHRLLAFSAENETGIGTECTDRLTGLLFAAYFVQGLDIGAQDTLLSLAEQAGLDADRARIHLGGDPERDLALFLANISAYQLDLHAVPCFIFDRRFVLAGAQETAAFLPLLDLALSDPNLDSA